MDHERVNRTAVAAVEASLSHLKSGISFNKGLTIAITFIGLMLVCLLIVTEYKIFKRRRERFRQATAAHIAELGSIFHNGLRP